MIPKIIHYTWFSDDEMPAKIKGCIESWKRLLPDYELRHWGMNDIKDIDSGFLREALQARKWAYASDFVRLYAIEKFGGIYLDTDVLLFQKPDRFLSDKCFIGAESSTHLNGASGECYLSSHCFGAEAHHPFIQRCLAYFEGRKFIHSENAELPPTMRLNLVLLPYIQSEIAKLWGYDASIARRDSTQQLMDGLTVYPCDYFDPQCPTSTSICFHYAMGSWREGYTAVDMLNISKRWTWKLKHALKSFFLKRGYVLTRLD